MDLIAFIPQVILHQLISPYLFVPAIAVGWFARTRGQIVAGAAAIAIASLALSFLQRMPEGAQRAYALMPLVIISPLAWGFAIAALKKRLRANEPQTGGEGGVARKVVRAIIGIVIGAPVGGALGALIGSLAADYFEISNFEGGAGYYVLFLYVFPGIVIGAIAGAIILWRWRR